VKNHPLRYCIVTVCLLLLTAASTVAGQELQVAPSDTTVVDGTTFQIRIVANSSVTSLMGYDIIVAFDTSLVELIDVVEGSLPGSGGATTFFHWFGAGIPSDTVHVNGAVLGTTVDGPGVLFVITFKAIFPGITPVEFIATEMRDNLNVDIAHNAVDGSITVEKSIPVRSSTWGNIKSRYR
jgi:hypothetical protein